MIIDAQRPDSQEVLRRKGTTKELYKPTYLLFKAAVDHMKDV